MFEDTCIAREIHSSGRYSVVAKNIFWIFLRYSLFYIIYIQLCYITFMTDQQCTKISLGRG